MTRHQVIDAAVRKWVPKSLVDDCRKTRESVTFIDANLYFPIRAEFRRIMDKEETCPIYGKKQ